MIFDKGNGRLAMLHFTVISIFPRMFDSVLSHTILKRAQEKKLIKIDLVNLRDHTSDRHRTTDDTPYGGGQGMKPFRNIVV